MFESGLGQSVRACLKKQHKSQGNINQEKDIILCEENAVVYDKAWYFIFIHKLKINYKLGYSQWQTHHYYIMTCQEDLCINIHLHMEVCSLKQILFTLNILGYAETNYKLVLEEIWIPKSRNNSVHVSSTIKDRSLNIEAPTTLNKEFFSKYSVKKEIKYRLLVWKVEIICNKSDTLSPNSYSEIIT